jgi:hypothetical protein
MSRQRVPRGEVLQAAYGVLDKYKMNRSFFVKSDQEDCEILPPIQEAIDPTESSATKNKDSEKTENITENVTIIPEEKTEFNSSSNSSSTEAST